MEIKKKFFSFVQAISFGAKTFYDNIGVFALSGIINVALIASAVAAFSIGGIPPFACFISEFLIFVGAVTAGGSAGFYFLPTVLMLVATVFSLAYVLRYIWKVFLESPKLKTERTRHCSRGSRTG